MKKKVIELAGSGELERMLAKHVKLRWEKSGGAVLDKVIAPNDEDKQERMGVTPLTKTTIKTISL